MSDERSSFSIGFTLRCTTVSTSDASKACVAATTTCRLAASNGSAPERDYATNLRKCWLIRPTHVRAGQTLALSFARFDLEQHYDTVKVFDGPTAASPALHTGQGFSGLHRGAALRSLERSLPRTLERARCPFIDHGLAMRVARACDMPPAMRELARAQRPRA